MSTSTAEKKTARLSVGDAALTMAIGIVVDRLGRLSAEDQEDVLVLVKELRNAQTAEEVEAIRVALKEILEENSGGLQIVKAASPASRPAALQEWVDDVSARVQKLRKQAGLTQAELSQKCGLPQSHISRIESARLSPSHATLERIAKAIGKPLSELDPNG